MQEGAATVVLNVLPEPDDPVAGRRTAFTVRDIDLLAFTLRQLLANDADPDGRRHLADRASAR